MRLKLLTLAIALAALSPLSHGEDLIDTYREARANDPVLSQADATRLATGEGIDQARALLLPQISAGLTVQQSSGGNSGTNQNNTGTGVGTGTTTGVTTTDGVGHIRTRDVSATLSQTVLDLSKIADLKAAHSQANAQDQLYSAAEQALFVRVATAYFGILTNQDALTFAKANEESFKQSFEQADQRYKVGLSAVTDSYQAKAQYEAAKAQTITAQNTLNDAREALSQITGKPVGELKRLRQDLPLDAPVPADANAWVQDAMKYNPTLLSQVDSVEAAEHNISAARAGHLPTITATVSRSKTTQWLEHGSANYAGNGDYGTVAGLTLSVPIFSGGATQSRVRQSIYQRDEAQDSAESERRQVKRDTLNYYRSVVAGISQVESGKSAVDSGEKALDATKAGFSVGTKTITDVLLAIQTLTSSESSYSQARHQFVLNKLLLKQSAGTIEYKDIQGVNGLLQ